MIIRNAEAKYGIIIKNLFSLLSPIFEKKHNESKFS